MSQRADHGIRRSNPITLTVDGVTVSAFAGESLATALLAANIKRFRFSTVAGTPRSAFCWMGVCQECQVLVNGEPALACSYPVRAGLRVVLGAASMDKGAASMDKGAASMDKGAASIGQDAASDNQSAGE